MLQLLLFFCLVAVVAVSLLWVIGRSLYGILNTSTGYFVDFWQSSQFEINKPTHLPFNVRDIRFSFSIWLPFVFFIWFFIAVKLRFVILPSQWLKLCSLRHSKSAVQIVNFVFLEFHFICSFVHSFVRSLHLPHQLETDTQVIAEIEIVLHVDHVVFIVWILFPQFVQNSHFN